jgi:HAD superfamily hydrolase (TIGR01458 family)
MTSTYDALLLDLSGVLYDGDTIIPGARETVAAARDRGLILRFVTNTATKPAATLIADMQRMRIDIRADEIFTAPMAALSYLQQHGLRPYLLLHQAIRHEFDALDQRDPNCVVLGDAREDLTYANLNTAFRLCKQGAPLIGIGMNKYFMDNDGLMLDAGAYIRAIEWAADVAAIVMGKPSADFFAQVVRSTGVSAERCLMVGDDVMADVVGALDAGLQGCLVKTGKFLEGDEAKLPPGAQLIDSIRDLLARADI